MQVHHIGPFHEDPNFKVTPPPREEVTPEIYAFIGRCVPIVCTDLVFIDDERRFVLAYRRNACARGWWWKGGSRKAGMTREASLAALMQREIGFMPDGVHHFAHFDHFWSERGEFPHEVGRHDIIDLHIVRVNEATIAKIKLDPTEYDAERGFMRYNGTQEVRPVVKAAYETYLNMQRPPAPYPWNSWEEMEQDALVLRAQEAARGGKV